MSNAQFDGVYYDYDYFASTQGKSYKRPDGRVEFWGYKNPNGFWDGCHPISVAWKDVFGLERCNTDTGLCKVCDVGCGRGQFVWALRNLGVEAWGFDFSKWAIENKFKRCQDGWVIQWDATKGWPYGDKSFDLTVALDFLEHIYLDDLDFVIEEMLRVSKRWIFLQIGTTPEKGYILKKGETIPVELEVNTVAGHVTVCKREWWVERLKRGGWRLRDDLVAEFVKRVDRAVIENWVQNTIIVIERV